MRLRALGLDRRLAPHALPRTTTARPGTGGAYRAPVVKCYARLRQVTGFYRGDAYAEYRARREKDGGKFDQEDARDDAYLEVPAAAAFLDVSHPHFILGGPLLGKSSAKTADHSRLRARGPRCGIRRSSLLRRVMSVLFFDGRIPRCCTGVGGARGGVIGGGRVPRFSQQRTSFYTSRIVTCSSRGLGLSLVVGRDSAST